MCGSCVCVHVTHACGRAGVLFLLMAECAHQLKGRGHAQTINRLNPSVDPQSGHALTNQGAGPLGCGAVLRWGGGGGKARALMVVGRCWGTPRALPGR